MIIRTTFPPTGLLARKLANQLNPPPTQSPGWPGGSSAGMVVGLAFDSFLGAVLAHWMQSAFAACGLFAAAALLALGALLACLLHARRAIAGPPAEPLRYE